MKTIRITIFATPGNTECQTRAQFDALIAGSIAQFEREVGCKLRRRADSQGVPFASDIDYKLVEGWPPGARSDAFAVRVDDEAGIMRAMDCDEIERAMTDIIAEFDLEAVQ